MPAGMTINEYGPWNPGVLSQLPPEYLPLSTIFRQENTTTSIKTARELSDFSGLPAQDLVAFRTERLIEHELLIRVMADLAVPDGTSYEDLGINFRAIATTILANYIRPNFEAIHRGHDAMRDAALEWHPAFGERRAQRERCRQP